MSNPFAVRIYLPSINRRAIYIAGHISVLGVYIIGRGHKQTKKKKLALATRRYLGDECSQSHGRLLELEYLVNYTGDCLPINFADRKRAVIDEYIWLKLVLSSASITKKVVAGSLRIGRKIERERGNNRALDNLWRNQYLLAHFTHNHNSFAFLLLTSNTIMAISGC